MARLGAAQSAVVDMARAELAGFAATVDLSDARLARDAFVEFVPILVREYGDLAGVAAAEWYEEVRAAQVSGQFHARVAAGASQEAVAGSVRAAAGHLFADNPAGFLDFLSGAIQRHITYSGRSTVSENVRADRAKPRFARVPSGSSTCAFCMMLASRGFVYGSRRTAGEFDHFHDDCDCLIVPEWDALRHHIEGYDPDKMFDQYMAARAAAGSSDQAAILAQMREMYGLD